MVLVRPLNVTSRKQETSFVGKLADKNSDFSKVEPFLRDASHQPSITRDVDNTFICDANGEIQHMLGMILIPYLCKLLVVPLRKGPKSEKVENVLS